MPTAFEEVWGWFHRIIPVPKSADFNGAVLAWSQLTAHPVTEVQLDILKKLYGLLIDVIERGPQETMPATKDNVFAAMGLLAGKDFNASDK